MDRAGAFNLKKTLLKPHLEFVSRMYRRVQGTELEERWGKMKRCIEDDSKL
jgi:hypothetical protein